MAQIPLKNQGYCNKSYLTTIDSKKYVIKEFINKEVDRKLEFKIQNLASKKKISPKAISLDEQKMLSEFIKGVHLKKLSRKNSKALAQSLRKLHKIKVRSKKIKLSKLLPFSNYHLINQTKRFKPSLSLTHNDLNHKNVIFSKSAKLIDFEYAMIGDIYFDLASVLVEFELDQRYFLNIYFQNKSYDLMKIKLYKKIYKEVVKEWFKRQKEIKA